jgi:hypothetical protein
MLCGDGFNESLRRVEKLGYSLFPENVTSPMCNTQANVIELFQLTAAIVGSKFRWCRPSVNQLEIVLSVEWTRSSPS